MPIYEYKCSECGKVYEKRQKFTDPPDTVCTCEKRGAVSRITSAPALVFKGSGWYINDYARSGGGPAAKPASGSTESSTKSESSDSSTSSSSSSTSSAETASTTAPASKS